MVDNAKMKTRRGILFALVLVFGLAAAAAVNPLAASAQVGNHRQAVPSTGWGAPMATPDLPVGIGQWVYVAPIPEAGPGQMATTGYVYGPTFFPDGANGVVGLSSDAEGPIAGIKVESPANSPAATIRYDWSPGKFYFLLAYHLGDGWWAGWVYDNAAAVWTPIGAVRAATPALLHNLSMSIVYGAQGAPTVPFGQEGASVEQCSAFPRVDAYFYPPILYWETTFAVSAPGDVSYYPWDCPTEATTEYGWAHFRLGSLPPG